MLQPTTTEPPTTPCATDPEDHELGGDGSRVVEDHGFAIVPDWSSTPRSPTRPSVFTPSCGASGAHRARMPSRGLARSPPAPLDRLHRPGPARTRLGHSPRPAPTTSCSPPAASTASTGCPVIASGCAQRSGQPVARWLPKCLAVAIELAVVTRCWLAVVTRCWPAPDVVPALLPVAADPQTCSPARLAEAGPWWDGARPATHGLVGTRSPASKCGSQSSADAGPPSRPKPGPSSPTKDCPSSRVTVTRRLSASGADGLP